MWERHSVICSAYFPYDSRDKPEEFINLVDYWKTNNMPALYGIDANAHHHSWGSKDINDRGENLLEFIITLNLMINNIGCKPTFVIKNRQEVLDITLSSSELYSFIREWKVTELILTSDHKCITFDLNLDTPPHILFRNPAATNWTIFIHQLETKISQNNIEPNLANTDELDDEIIRLQNMIIESYEAACPLHKHKSGQSVKYYTSEDRQSRAKLRKAFNRARSSKSTVPGRNFTISNVNINRN